MQKGLLRRMGALRGTLLSISSLAIVGILFMHRGPGTDGVSMGSQGVGMGESTFILSSFQWLFSIKNLPSFRL